VLDNCNIASVGDEEKLAEHCSKVIEIDLSHNKLHDWNEVMRMNDELVV
jgi:hypothetical protein